MDLRVKIFRHIFYIVALGLTCQGLHFLFSVEPYAGVTYAICAVAIAILWVTDFSIWKKQDRPIEVEFVEDEVKVFESDDQYR